VVATAVSLSLRIAGNLSEPCFLGAMLGGRLECVAQAFLSELRRFAWGLRACVGMGAALLDHSRAVTFGEDF